MIENRKARVIAHRDGHRIEVSADVRSGGFVYPYRSHHPAEQDVDHERILSDLEERIDARAAVLPEIHALIGRAGVVEGLGYRVTEANIQVHGPASFVLLVKWQEGHVDGATTRAEIRRRYSHPKDAPAADALVAEIEAGVSSRAKRAAKASATAESFLTGRRGA